MSIFLLFASATTTFAQNLKNCHCYVNLMAKSKIEFVSEVKSASAQTGTIGEDYRKKNILRFFYKSDAPNEWKKVSIKFKAHSSDTVNICLSSSEQKGKDGKILPIATYYDDVKVNGKLLPNGDFSKDFLDWHISFAGNEKLLPKIIQTKEIVKDGKCARITRKGQISQTIKVKAGKVYELSFSMRYAGIFNPLDDDMALDFSDTFNDNSATMKKIKVALPNPKISEEGTLINGIRFKSTKVKGRSALILRNKLLPSVKSRVDVKINENQARTRYFYFVHTASSAMPKNTHSIGRVLMTTKSGKLIKNDVNYKHVYGYQDEKINGLNAKPYKVDGGTVYFSRFAMPENDLVDTISFVSFYKSPWVIYAGTFSDTNVYPFEIFKPNADEWSYADVPNTYYDVEKKSALDLSEMVFTPTPAGATGRAIVSPRGTIAFEKTPEKDAKFKSFSLWQASLFRHIPAEERKDFIRKFAVNVRKQGYNLVRIKLDFLKDFCDKPHKPELFDMTDFLLSEFKKNGIYYQIIFGTYADGRKDYKFGVHNDVKMEIIIGEEKSWQRWKDSAIEFLEHINPYTGSAWKDEPSLLCVEYYNELTNSLGRLYQLTPALRDATIAKFLTYLKAKYKTIDDLNKAWNDTNFISTKFDFKSFDDLKKYNIYARNCDWLAFGWEHINKFGKFAEDVVKSTGYKGLVCECNTAATFTALEYANRFADVAIVNRYFSHPSGFGGTNVSCSQDSAVAGYWINDLVSRGFNNRPYLITEYNYCFWNKHRYEALVLIAPYCAYQNMSAMTIHQDPFPIRKKVNPHMGTFAVGGSPLMRASELLMSCFFMRGDVKPAKHRVDMTITDDFLRTLSANKARNPLQTSISSLTGFRMKYEKMDYLSALKNVKTKPADIEIAPIGSAILKQEEWFQEVLADKSSDSFNLEKFVGQLREKGILAESNKTDIKRGIFQTDTEQITRDIKNISMSVITGYSEAVAMKTPKQMRLSKLKVLSSTEPATIGVCSIDGKKLGESLRMVFIYATREVNEDMKTSFDNSYAITIGTKNIMLKNGIVKAELRVDDSKKYTVYPLSLNGVRREKLQMPVVDGVMKISIDNSKLKYGATTMFEIVAE